MRILKIYHFKKIKNEIIGKVMYNSIISEAKNLIPIIRL